MIENLIYLGCQYQDFRHSFTLISIDFFTVLHIIHSSSI